MQPGSAVFAKPESLHHCGHPLDLERFMRDLYCSNTHMQRRMPAILSQLQSSPALLLLGGGGVEAQ